MDMKKGVVIISLVLVSFLLMGSVAFVSAGWWSDFFGKITGNDVAPALCTDQTCDNNVANGIVDSWKNCPGNFSTWYQNNAYRTMTFTNNWAYVNSEYLYNYGNGWYWAQGNCSLGTYARNIFINTTTGWAWGSFDCRQNGANYCGTTPTVTTPTVTCNSFTY